MVIYVVSLYTRCLRYNICSAWFLDIRISTCYLEYISLAIIHNHGEAIDYSKTININSSYTMVTLYLIQSCPLCSVRHSQVILSMHACVLIRDYQHLYGDDLTV